MPKTSNGKFPPGRKGHRFSNLWKRLGNFAGLFDELQQEYGPIATYQLPLYNCCAVFDSDLIHEVLVANQSSFSKNPIGKRILRAPTLLTSDGGEHRRRRKLLQPSFGNKSVEVFGKVVVEQAAAHRDEWHDGQIVDMQAEIKRFGINVATAMFFGEEGIVVDPALVQEAADALRRRMKLAFLPFHRLLWQVPTPANRRHQRALDVLDGIFAEIIQRARNTTEERGDVISLIARAQDEEGIEQSYSDLEVQEEAYVLLFAGHETCSNVLTWCFSHLLQRPATRDRLEKEMDELVGNRSLIPQNYSNLPYASAVINETLRIEPPTYYVGRIANEDCSIGGYFIPKGTLVQPVFRKAHRSEKHFHRADEFIPERWLDGGSQADRPEHAYTPFGSGARICIGWRMALVETTIFLASVVQRWHLESVSGQHTVPKAINSMEMYRYPGSLPVVVRERRQG